MATELQERADRLLEEALAAATLQDPRPALRARLRALRGTPAFGELVADYEERLVPRIVRGELEPLEGWLEFGRRIAEAAGSGREVIIDASGRATPANEPPGPGELLLHLPEQPDQAALPLWLPREPSPAQAATLALLVERRQQL